MKNVIVICNLHLLPAVCRCIFSQMVVDIYTETCSFLIKALYY